MANRRDLLSYDSLYDPLLREALSQPHNFQHLRRAGLITSDGHIRSKEQVKRLQSSPYPR